MTRRPGGRRSRGSLAPLSGRPPAEPHRQGVEPTALVMDESTWENGAEFVGYRHPDLPIMWRLARHPHPSPSGWALLDLRGTPYPHVIESGVMTEREVKDLINHREYLSVMRRAARAMDRAIDRGDLS